MRSTGGVRFIVFQRRVSLHRPQPLTTLACGRPTPPGVDAVQPGPADPRSIPPRPAVHYTQQPSRLEACNDNDDRAVLRLHGGGVLTATIIEQAFFRMRDSHSVPPNLLIDLRDVAGYESHAVECANSLLEQAPTYGVRRIAFLASSGAVHAAAQVASSRAIVPLRSFANERSARDWLVS